MLIFNLLIKEINLKSLIIHIDQRFLWTPLGTWCVRDAWQTLRGRIWRAIYKRKRTPSTSRTTSNSPGGYLCPRHPNVRKRVRNSVGSLRIYNGGVMGIRIVGIITMLDRDDTTFPEWRARWKRDRNDDKLNWYMWFILTKSRMMKNKLLPFSARGKNTLLSYNNKLLII